MRFEDIVESIGNTPLVGIHSLSPNPDVKIYAKLEGENPTGSVKDRIARQMVEGAEASGTLREGARLLEPSSGNTGIALAMVARKRGYSLTVVMPENVSIERRQLLEIFGAELVLSPAEGGSNGAIKVAESMVSDGEYTMLFQYGNPDNPGAHYETTGPEIYRDCPEVGYFVAGLGTGGTLTGVGRYLKDQDPEIQVVAVEPPSGEMVQGLRSLDDGYIPPVFDPSVLDRKFLVKADESVFYTREVLEREGVFAGISCGAAISGAVKLAGTVDRGSIVVLLPEGGWKYLSTRAWTDPLDEVVKSMETMLYF